MSAAPGRPRIQATVRTAQTLAERDGHFAVRQAVFVNDQRLFRESDRDEIDDDPGTIHLVADAGGLGVGAVRIYPLGATNRWQGDRLAVLPDYRASRVGVDLVQLAVRTAARHGGLVMEAHVQVANVPFFESLGWQVQGPTEIYVAALHQPMVCDLTGPGR